MSQQPGNASPLKAYSAANQTASKSRQVVMLYDAAIRFLQQASEAIANNDPELRYQKLSKASEVIMALQGCLDFDAPGDAAHVLNDFYSSIIVQIMGLHRTHERGVCTRLVAELKEMRDTWDAIDRGIAVQPQVPQAPVAIADPMGMSA